MPECRMPYELHFAPLQGYTDWVYRDAFEKCFGGVDAYYTPFIRVEQGGVRKKDLRDIDPLHNSVPKLIPQILPGNSEELRMLAGRLQKEGYTFADINLGCPFPLITGKKKGAGMLPYPERVKELLETLREFPQLRFSLKMRLGYENAGEWVDLMDAINTVRLEYITVHARIAKQQYKGIPDWEAFEEFYHACQLPLLYNGDLKTKEDIQKILQKFPLLRGVMIGRGLLSSPLLGREYRDDETFSEEFRMSLFYRFHQMLFSGYAEFLSDENQLLRKMKSLWDYFLPEGDKKQLKKIKKATKLRDYEAAVRMLFLPFQKM